MKSVRYLATAIGITTLLAEAFALADGPLNDIRRTLDGNVEICGNFTQEKTLTALNRPLVSSGRFSFVAEKGILWEVKEPFAIRLVLTDKNMVRWNLNGSAIRTSLEQEPHFKALSQVLIAALSGNIPLLTSTFKASAEVREIGWELMLMPRDARFSAIIKTIHLSGDQFVRRLSIMEGHGDITEVQFTQLENNGCDHSDIEKAQLAQ
jgi:hypothetical protein